MNENHRAAGAGTLSLDDIAAELTELHALIDQLDRKLEEFDEALTEEPRTIDKPRAGYLELLARYAHQLAVRIAE